MRKPWARLKSESGFTLLELMMTVGLAGLVMFAVFTFYSDFTKKMNKISEEVENTTDIESGQRIVLRDLKAIDPSFGVMTVRDDRGQKFFEYFPDVPDDAIHPEIADRQAAVERVYTMKWKGGFQELIFMALDQNAHELPSLIYDPTRAFDMPPAANFMTEGAVTWVGLDHRPTTGPLPHLRPVSEMRPAHDAVWKGYWQVGQLLMLDTPLLFRAKDVGAGEGGTYPPRPVAFVGMVNSLADTASNFLAIDKDKAKTHDWAGVAASEVPIDTTHPVESTVHGAGTLDLTTARDFFWDLPAAGGGQPMVRLRPVKLIKYSIEQMYPKDTDPEKQKIVRLWKQVLTNGEWDARRNRFIIAEKLKTVQFKRISAGEKAILFDISRNELKKGGEP